MTELHDEKAENMNEVDTMKVFFARMSAELMMKIATLESFHIEELSRINDQSDPPATDHAILSDDEIAELDSFEKLQQALSLIMPKIEYLDELIDERLAVRQAKTKLLRKEKFKARAVLFAHGLVRFGKIPAIVVGIEVFLALVGWQSVLV